MKIALRAVLLLAGVIRLHNALSYNPLWGYDGGAHLAYLEILKTHHRLPTLQETYLAWHEPLYYVLASLTSGAGLKIFQALLGVAFVAAVGWLAYTLTRRRSVALLIMTTTAVLPPAVLLSNYPTNELLAQVLFVVTLTVATTSLRAKRSNLEIAVVLGLLLAAAQWTKLSALLVVVAVAAAFVAQRRWRALAVALGIWFVLSLPWQIYREIKLGGAFRINNVEQAANTGHPLRFYVWFNADVLRYPYWHVGGDSFWSVLYASTFADYDNMFSNVDRDNALPASEKFLTGSGRFVSLHRFAAALVLNRYSLVFIPIMLLGIFAAWRQRQKPEQLLLLAFVIISFGALMYNAGRYPYLERGTLKPIFILTALLIPFILGYDALIRRFGRHAIIALGGVVALFVALAVPLIWLA